LAICIKEALRLIASHVQKVSYEIVPIENSVDRICAENLYAKYPLPNYNNSAMDGYGIKLDDQSKKVKVVNTILAGSPIDTNIKIGEVVKIMTGAKVPESIEAIVPIEDVIVHNDNTITLPSNIKNNQHIRFCAEEIQIDDLLLKDGEDINFASIALLASQGITHVKVYRKPQISVFASGEELKLHYEKINQFQLYNSNTPTLLARAKELGGEAIFTGMARDNIESLKEMIENSLQSDFIITSGGISVGDADFTREAFMQFDMEIIFDGIKIKPGKPTLFGKIGKTYILNLPGNPLAASLIFEIFGKAILQKLSGNEKIYHSYILGKIGEELPNKQGRTTLIPGNFDGEYFFPAPKRLPGMVGVLHNCNSMLILNKHQDLLKKESLVKILPINWKFFSNIQKDFFS
jgi:molybdopterin molybdotransferase